MKQFLVSIFCLLFTFTFLKTSQQTTDMIIYSFDRPLQLNALLESIHKYMSGLNSITIVYRASDDEFNYAYSLIKEHYPQIQLLKQGNSPREDFKPLTLKALTQSSNEYVIFAVDDNIVKDYVDLSYCIDMMNQTNAYGVYLRLGLNIDYCYTMNQPQAIPPYSHVEKDLYAWQFCQGTCDWAYPNTVDLTLFKKSDVLNIFNQLNYYSPNVLESVWSQNSAPIMQRIGLFFERSKIVNLPLNIVQQDWHNRNQQELLPADQLRLFFENKKIDITPLHQIDNKSPHMEYCPTLIERN